MRRTLARLSIAAAAVLALTAFAAAQQPALTGSWHCATPTQHHEVAVPGNPHHIFVLEQGECTSTGGNEIEGESLRTDYGTSIGEMTAVAVRARGFDVITAANGDKLLIRRREFGRPVHGQLRDLHGRWRSVGGTGKLRHLHLHGTYTVTMSPDGSAIVHIVGYTHTAHRH